MYFIYTFKPIPTYVSSSKWGGGDYDHFCEETKVNFAEVYFCLEKKKPIY